MADVHFGDRYLRNRPFLIINMVRRPAKKDITNKKGWGDEAINWSIFEQPILVDRVKDNQLAKAAIIIDVLNAKAVKNRFADEVGSDGTPVTEQQVVSHFLEKYKADVEQAVSKWVAQNKNKAQDYVTKVETIAGQSFTYNPAE